MSLLVNDCTQRYTKEFIKSKMEEICNKADVKLTLCKPFTNYEDASWSSNSSYSTDDWIGIGKYDVLEFAFISFFHELGHISLIQTADEVTWKYSSIYQLELAATHIGLCIASDFSIHFSDVAVDWLMSQAKSYIKSHDMNPHCYYEYVSNNEYRIVVGSKGN